MLAFVLPFKPKSQSRNWQKDCALLEATISSLLNQESEDYKIYVVYSDNPNLQLLSDKISLIHFDHAFVEFENTPDADNSLSNRDKLIVARRWDKCRKIFYGCKKAKEDGCLYIMSVDSDDLISNKLVSYIDEKTREKDIPGFYITKGYLYRPSSKRIIRVEKNMQSFNGSTHILRSDLIKIPDFENGGWLDFNLFTSHGWIVDRMKLEHKVDLEPIVFPAVIYVAHGGNISNVNPVNIFPLIKYFTKLIIRGRWVTNDLKKEFSIQN